jgi:hypothetical protein
MSPLAVLTGIIMGSAVTATIGLAMVIIVFLTLTGEHPRLAEEHGVLLRSFGLFFGLALISGYAFVGTLRQRRWRWYAQAGTWLGIATMAWFYWPR